MSIQSSGTAPVGRTERKMPEAEVFCSGHFYMFCRSEILAVFLVFSDFAHITGSDNTGRECHDCNSQNG